ncbi:hypothetical protein NBRC10512_007984 [Rhodotorula toruloides]|uniref:RHTO0S04e02454g1_1 n=2 Tax=Rhodotorula toruloides TaxID=5286 RepID=A0A061ANI4_RHOTO|nr:uncharacterized protein RHTO_02561 [Rhodotorula toruloides NP11]EMS20613.1 hypothetical protein RHTO_02561 [Rhodotorula toruloides NP11]CDR39167.1 RHTO0S04e02454g1_1 [Rhodotorula toruloides]
MSTSPAQPPAPPQSAPADSAPPPPSASTASPAPALPRKAGKTSPSRRRKPLRRRGARVESESEEETSVAPAGNARDGTASDSDSDFEPPSPDSADEDDDEDDSDAIDGAPEPKTPAAASVEQLPPVDHGDRKAAVLTAQLAHPSWSDMPAPGEGGADELPTLDFANLSIDGVQALPSPRAAAKAPAKKAPVASEASKEDKPQLSKKQLLLQKREAKSAALKAKDPEAWASREKERLEKEEAKKAARKERVKEKRKEKKLKEKAEKAAGVEGTGAAPVSAPSATAAPASGPAQPARSTRPPKPARPVVPSRPSRTALALGLVNSTPASPASSSPTVAVPKANSQVAPSVVPLTGASETTPIVPLATRQPAFVQRDQDGRPIPQPSFFDGPPRRRRSLGKEDPFASFWRGSGRGGAAGRGRGRGGWQRAVPDRSDVQTQDEEAAPTSDAQEMVGLTAGSEAFASSRGRGRGRGGLSARGGISGRGGLATGPPGAINPRYAHLPFHPRHRFPSPAPSSSAQSTSKEPVAPEATTAAPDESLFDRPGQGRDESASVKLPGKQQVSLAIKGSAAKAADAEAAESKAREEQEQAKKLAAEQAVAEDLERRRQQGASVLYAADPTRFASPPIEPVHQPAVSLPSYEQRRPPDAAIHSSVMYQVPPHLQSSAAAAQQAAYVHRQDSPVYYAPHAPQPYYSPEAFPLVPSPPVPTPPPTFLPAAPAAPSSSYFLPPRANKRVEIKAPSRDGQSPVPVKTVSSPSTDALTAAQRARIEALQREEEQRRQQYGDAASSVGAVAGSSSPVSTRAPFPPSPQQQRQHLAFSPPAFSPASAYYPAAPSPMYTSFAQQPPPPQAFDPSSHPAYADQYGFYSPPTTQQHHQHQQAYPLQHSFQPSMSPPGTTFYHQPHLADAGMMPPSGYYAVPNHAAHYPQQHGWPTH